MRFCKCFIILIVLTMFLSVAVACTSSDNGTIDLPDNGISDDKNDSRVDSGDKKDNTDDGEEIDWDGLWHRDFEDGQYMKVEWWQKVDGEESDGWMTIEVSVENNVYNIDCEGKVGDYEFSDTFSTAPPDWEGGSVRHLFYQGFTNKHWQIRDIFENAVIPISENYEGLDVVGERHSYLGYDVTSEGFKTIAGIEGYHFLLKYEGKRQNELCISPHIPINLYHFNISYDGHQYEMEVVDFRN